MHLTFSNIESPCQECSKVIQQAGERERRLGLKSVAATGALALQYALRSHYAHAHPSLVPHARAAYLRNKKVYV